MGEITDAVGIQFRLLNTSRGPAVWSPRAQCDKQAYRLKMLEALDSHANLKIKQAEVAGLIVEGAQACHPEGSEGSPGTRLPAPGSRLSASGEGNQHSALGSQPEETGSRQPEAGRRVLGIRLRDGRNIGAQAVIITTGTFL